MKKGEVNPSTVCYPALQVGDIIVAIDGVAGADFNSMIAQLKAVSVGATVELTVERARENNAVLNK